MENQKQIEAIARETFRGVNVFYQKRDVEGLRHYVHPELLDKWKKDWKSFAPESPSDKIELKVIQQSTSAFTVELKVHSHSQVWNFQREENKWMLSSAKSAVAEQIKKAA